MGLGLAVASVWFSGAPAQADNYVGATGVKHNCAERYATGLNNTDPNPLTWANSALEPATASAVDWAMYNRFNPTRHDVSKLSSVTTNTDIVAYDQDYTSYCFIAWHPESSVIGMTTCVSLVSNGACEKHEVRFDLSWMNTVDQNWKNIIACHEAGHAVGLAHRGSATSENGCMVSGMPHAGELTLHDVTHINGGPWIKPDYGNRYLNNNQSMKSYDALYTAWLQTDGNFVIYGPAGPIWASGTSWAGSSTWAVMQGDGNFVVYMSDAYAGAVPICSTGTPMYPGSHIQMQTDGNLVVYSEPGHIARWASKSRGCV
jgi:hypothetical protein